MKTEQDIHGNNPSQGIQGGRSVWDELRRQHQSNGFPNTQQQREQLEQQKSTEQEEKKKKKRHVRVNQYGDVIEEDVGVLGEETDLDASPPIKPGNM